MSRSALFSEFSVRGLTLKNRIVASPMWQYCAVRGFPTDWHLMNLGRLADGGAGLVFQEGTAVERRGAGTVGDLAIWSDEFVAPLSRMVRLIHANGAAAGIQLMHCGRKARTRPPAEGRGIQLERTPDIVDWDEWQPISASAVPLSEGAEPPREMSTTDIAQVIEAFGQAARRSLEAGYDVIEIHAAHGYLVHQFLSPLTNQRLDGYGGTYRNRTRLLLEIIESVRASWDSSKPLFVRLSSIDNAGWTISDSVELARTIKLLGVDLIDCSSGGLVGSPLPKGSVAPYGYQVPYAEDIRRQAEIATMAVGLIVHAAQAEQIIANGQSDLVALARELIYNPAWPIDAAYKLGVNANFSHLPERISFWLGGRAAAKPDLIPSTFAMPYDDLS